MMRAIGLLVVAWCASGCVTVYQPLRGLQKPVVLNTEAANFEGLRVQVRCPAGTFVKGGEANKMCRKVEKVFANQGATIANQANDPKKPDLIVEIESRLIADDTDRVFSLLCIASGTLIPWINDTSLAEDVTIRDGSGFLLATESYQARFVSYFGLAVWVANAFMDLFLRTPEEKLLGKSQSLAVSKDFFSQLSQLAFHARTRALVLKGFENSP